MRISDWSSDVCSSDLLETPDVVVHVAEAQVDDGAAPGTDVRRAGVHQVAVEQEHRPGRARRRHDAALLSQPRHRLAVQRPQRIGGGREVVTGKSEEHRSELQSLMRISYAVFCLKKKKKNNT